MTGFVLNGAPRQVNFAPGCTVLDHLRLGERLTGTKEGCAEGDCGACTIVIGRPAPAGLKFSAVNSCIMLAADLDGCVVLTAEGLVQNDVLAPAQQVLVEFHGSQCGFCTPGFVMSLYALSQSAEAKSEHKILDALAGNLCRCTGYRPILAAAAAMPQVADARAPSWAATLARMTADDTVPQSLAALDTLLAETPDAKLTAGTTDIGVGIAKYGDIPAHLVSLRGVTALQDIDEGSECLTIGAAATYSEMLPHLERHFANFAGLIKRIGSVQIRNLGTMGGNLCNASPIGDCAPCLIALDAILLMRSAAGERTLPVAEFFTGYRKTALGAGEYLRAIKIPYLREGEKFFAYKLAKRFDQDISTVAGAFKLHVVNGMVQGMRAGFGGMAATPVRAKFLEAALIGMPCTEHSFAKAAEKIATEFTPISDMRASAGYRRQAACGFLHRLGAAMAATGPTDIWAL